MHCTGEEEETEEGEAAAQLRGVESPPEPGDDSGEPEAEVEVRLGEMLGASTMVRVARPGHGTTSRDAAGASCDASRIPCKATVPSSRAAAALLLRAECTGGTGGGGGGGRRSARSTRTTSVPPLLLLPLLLLLLPLLL